MFDVIEVYSIYLQEDIVVEYRMSVMVEFQEDRQIYYCGMSCYGVYVLQIVQSCYCNENYLNNFVCMVFYYKICVIVEDYLKFQVYFYQQECFDIVGVDC